MKTLVEKHFDKVAEDYDYYKNRNSFYYENLKKLLGELIPKNKMVFEIGCGTGDLLVSLKPKNGVGYDISSKMISLAKIKHPQNNIKFLDHLPVTFHPLPDFIFMSDVIEHLENPKDTFDKISKLMDEKSKLVITMANPIWEPALMIAEKLGLKMPEGPHKRISNFQLSIFMEKSGMKIIKHDCKLLIPVKIPLLTNFVNKYLEKPLKKLAFIEYLVAVKF